MLIDEKRYCDLCHGVIVFGQKHVQVRSAKSAGQSRFDCSHYHHRFKGDCWDRQRRFTLPHAEASSGLPLPTLRATEREAG